GTACPSCCRSWWRAASCSCNPPRSWRLRQRRELPHRPRMRSPAAERFPGASLSSMLGLEIQEHQEEQQKLQTDDPADHEPHGFAALPGLWDAQALVAVGQRHELIVVEFAFHRVGALESLLRVALDRVENDLLDDR